MDTVARSEQSNDLPPRAWVLLIYTVPAAPTSKRAAVWREVKRLGALYLRDGVCALPDTDPARTGLEALAGRVQELGGQASVAWGAHLSHATAETLLAELTRARHAEYGEVAEAATDLLQHIKKEAGHHSFDRSVRVSLVGDLGRLQRWLEQIVARDYLQVGAPAPIALTLTACRAELERHTSLSSRLAV